MGVHAPAAAGKSRPRRATQLPRRAPTGPEGPPIRGSEGEEVQGTLGIDLAGARDPCFFPGAVEKKAGGGVCVQVGSCIAYYGIRPEANSEEVHDYDIDHKLRGAAKFSARLYCAAFVLGSVGIRPLVLCTRGL